MFTVLIDCSLCATKSAFDHWKLILAHYGFFYKLCLTNTELLQVGIFFLIHLFAWEILLLKKLEIEETKNT